MASVIRMRERMFFKLLVKAPAVARATLGVTSRTISAGETPPDSSDMLLHMQSVHEMGFGLNVVCKGGR